CYFFFQAEDGIRDRNVTGVQTCALPIFQGYAEGIRDGVFTGEDAEVGLNVIASEVNRLKVLINEMTLLAKLDSEKNDNEQEKIDLSELIQKAVDRVRPYAVEQSVVID